MSEEYTSFSIISNCSSTWSIYTHRSPPVHVLDQQGAEEHPERVERDGDRGVHAPDLVVRHLGHVQLPDGEPHPVQEPDQHAYDYHGRRVWREREGYPQGGHGRHEQAVDPDPPQPRRQRAGAERARPEAQAQNAS